MNICFFHWGFSGDGGICRVVSILANRFVTDGHSVYMIILTKWKRSDFIYPLSKEIRGIGWNDNSSMRKIILKGGVGRLRKILKRNSIDIIIPCGVLYYPMAALATKGLKTKCICWEHSNANNRADYKFQGEGRWLGAKLSDACVVLTKQDYDLYKKMYNPKVLKQIYNPVDPLLDEIQYIPKQKKRIITVARLTYQKNIPGLLRLARVVLEKNPDWKWDLYGGGSEDEERKLDEEIRNLGLDGCFRRKGVVDNLYELYPNYDFLVMTSHYEGFSMALIEASACNLPIIAYDVECGPREIIKDGCNGYLVSAYDERNMMAKLDFLMNTPNKVREMSINASSIRESFNIDKIDAQWAELFSEL